MSYMYVDLTTTGRNRASSEASASEVSYSINICRSVSHTQAHTGCE